MIAPTGGQRADAQHQLVQTRSGEGQSRDPSSGENSFDDVIIDIFDVKVAPCCSYVMSKFVLLSLGRCALPRTHA